MNFAQRIHPTWHSDCFPLTFPLPCYPENLNSEVITESELRASLRRQRFEELSEVRIAILETNGSLTIEREPDMTEALEHPRLMEQLDRIEMALSQINQS